MQKKKISVRTSNSITKRYFKFRYTVNGQNGMQVNSLIMQNEGSIIFYEKKRTRVYFNVIR